MHAGMLALMIIYGAHAAFDCICTVCALFGHSDAVPLPSSAVVWFGGFYARVFEDETVQQGHLVARLVVYYAAATSLARVVMICAPSSGTCACVTIMYCLQALSVEYEGYTGRSIEVRRARTASLWLAFMAACSLLMTLLLLP